MIPKDTKVYIINKTIGRDLAGVKERDGLNRKHIIYEGNPYNAVIGYYQYVKNNNYNIIDYYPGSNTGDFYRRSDFITEDDQRLSNIGVILDADLFEI